MTRAIPWTCDGCDIVVTLTEEPDLPPEGWRILHVLPRYGLNLALEPGNPPARLSLCPKCFDVFASNLVVDL